MVLSADGIYRMILIVQILKVFKTLGVWFIDLNLFFLWKKSFLKHDR